MLNLGHRHKTVSKGIFRKDIMIHQIPYPIPCLTWDTGTNQGVKAFLKRHYPVLLILESLNFSVLGVLDNKTGLSNSRILYTF